MLPVIPASPADGVKRLECSSERLGAGWVRVLRSGAAKQGALLREREIQSLRGEIEFIDGTVVIPESAGYAL